MKFYLLKVPWSSFDWKLLPSKPKPSDIEKFVNDINQSFRFIKRYGWGHDLLNFEEKLYQISTADSGYIYATNSHPQIYFPVDKGDNYLVFVISNDPNKDDTNKGLVLVGLYIDAEPYFIKIFKDPNSQYYKDFRSNFLPLLNDYLNRNPEIRKNPNVNWSDVLNPDVNDSLASKLGKTNCDTLMAPLFRIKKENMILLDQNNRTNIQNQLDLFNIELTFHNGADVMPNIGGIINLLSIIQNQIRDEFHKEKLTEVIKKLQKTSNLDYYVVENGTLDNILWSLLFIDQTEFVSYHGKPGQRQVYPKNKGTFVWAITQNNVNKFINRIEKSELEKDKEIVMIWDRSGRGKYEFNKVIFIGRLKDVNRGYTSNLNRFWPNPSKKGYTLIHEVQIDHIYICLDKIMKIRDKIFGSNFLNIVKNLSEDDLANMFDTFKNAVKSELGTCPDINPSYGFSSYVPKYVIEKIELGLASYNNEIEEAFIYNVESLLFSKGQLIFYGPIGTGKTYLARLFLERRSQNKSNYEFITFHPNYSYEELVEGIRPLIKDGNIFYNIVDGVFKALCKRAFTELMNHCGIKKTWEVRDQDTITQATDSSDLNFDLPELDDEERRRIRNCLKRGDYPKFYLVIDEINRGDLAKVLGELITLLEMDKRLCMDNEIIVTLPYSKEKFGVPPNLFIIGTMNTSDRSIALIDAAIRRRFAFIEIMPDKEKLKTIINCAVVKKELKELAIKVFEKLNERLRENFDRDHQIGHSFFIPLGKAHSNEEFIKLFKGIWYTEIIPLVQEFFYNNIEVIESILKGFIKKEGDTSYKIMEYHGDEFIEKLKEWLR